MALAIYKYYAPYGTQTDFYFCSEDPTDTNDLYIGTAWAASDAQISKDGGAEAATTNTPSRITSFVHKITLTATELSASRIIVAIRDQTEPEVFLPVILQITTRETLGTFVVDATPIGSNTSAVTYTGVGTGSGLALSGGATGSGLKATGQSSSAYAVQAVNAAGNLYLSNFFDQQLPAEATVAFAATDGIGKAIGRLVRRMLNKVTQTSAQQKVYADDSSTVVETMSVSDDGTTQTKGKAA